MKIDRVSSAGTMQSADTITENAAINIAKNAEKNAKKNTVEINAAQLSKAVDVLNKKAEQEDNYDVRFAIYKDTNRVIVQVVEKITNKVISSFPPKQILEMARMVEQEFKVLDKKI